MEHERKQKPEFFDPAVLETDAVLDGGTAEQHIADQAERDRARVEQENDGPMQDPRDPREPSQPFSGSEH